MDCQNNNKNIQKTLSDHDHHWATDKLSLSETSLDGDQNKIGPFQVQFYCQT